MTNNDRWTVDAVRALGTTTSIEIAGAILGIGRTKAYEFARTGDFPVAVIRAGRRYVVPVPALLALLGAPADAHRNIEAPNEDGARRRPPRRAAARGRFAPSASGVVHESRSAPSTRGWCARCGPQRQPRLCARAVPRRQCAAGAVRSVNARLCARAVPRRQRAGGERRGRGRAVKSGGGRRGRGHAVNARRVDGGRAAAT